MLAQKLKKYFVVKMCYDDSFVCNVKHNNGIKIKTKVKNFDFIE